MKTSYTLRFTAVEIEQIEAFCAQTGVEAPNAENGTFKPFLLGLLDVNKELLAENEALRNVPTPIVPEVNVAQTAEYLQLQEEKDSVSEKLENALAKLQAVKESAPSPAALVLNLEPNVRELLNLVAQRLSERYARKYPNGITPEHVLADMFIRYNREQVAEWFYPHVVPVAEVEKILNVGDNA